jgi:hypothetical protein
MRRPGFDQRYRLLMLAAAAALGAMPAHASVIISVTSVSAEAGESGSFDVIISNTGATQNIAAFSLGLSVASNGVTFTGGNEATVNTYIFNGDSFDLLTANPYTTVPPPPDRVWKVPICPSAEPSPLELLRDQSG